MRARLAALLRRTADRLAPQTHHVNVTHNHGTCAVYLDGEQIVKAIKHRNRRRGLGDAGI